MDKIVGIDLGTSTTCLSAVIDGEPVIVPDSRGNRVIPSYIYVKDDGRVLVGQQAKAEVIADPYSTIWATKRLIGRRFDDPHVQECLDKFSYTILPSDSGGVLAQARDQKFTPVEVSAIILKYMARLGSKSLNEEIKKAVITVPAYFNDPQRRATKEAGEKVGLDIAGLVNEPTAAALAWGYTQDIDQTIAVYDLGGGTFDVSILSISDGVYEVLATRGDDWLGGEDFDNRLVELLVEDFKQKHKINIYNDKIAHQRVKDAAEQAKIQLSGRESTQIQLPSICPDVSRWADVDATITREQFDYLVGDLVERTISIFESTVEDAGLKVDDLENVILVGGMTRIPLVRAKVNELIGKPADTSINPDEAVAMGASLHAAALSGEKIARKVEITEKEPATVDEQERTRPSFNLPTTVGQPPPFTDPQEMTTPAIASVGQPEMIEPPQPEEDSSAPEPASQSDGQLPISKQQGDFDAQLPAEKDQAPVPLDSAATEAPDQSIGEEFSTEEDSDIPTEPPSAHAESTEVIGERDMSNLPLDPQDIQAVTEPEVAEQPAEAEPAPAAQEKEWVDAPLLLDVLSQTVGIAELGGIFIPLIDRNSKLPARVSQVFTTCRDKQESIRIKVYQGDKHRVQGNVHLGEFVLEGIEMGSRGVPQIEVTFDIDQNGIFKVSACDLETKAEKEIRVEGLEGTAKES